MLEIKKPEYFFFIVIATGIFLRLIWVSDMEWKTDEKWMYSKAHEVVDTRHFPEAGMQSGGGIVNPGMSVGIFALVAAITSNPLEMNRSVELINILSILCFLFFVYMRVEPEERETWLAGIALASVSPLAVIFSRKIWAQDLLPILSFVIIYANSYRNKRPGAFVWGLAGALIGQVHMSGFFFAAGILVFTWLHDRYNHLKFHWKYWLAGSLLGSITIVPWILFIIHNPQESRQSFWYIFQFNFYLYWFLDAHGLNIMYSLRKEFWEFIKEPVVGGVPTYLIALAHLFLAAAGLITLSEIRKYAKRGVQFVKNKIPFEKIFFNMTTTRFYLLSILTGLGIFMSLSGITIQPHYLICAFPFSYIFLAKIFQNRKRLFHAVVVAQLFITIMFLIYIHQHNGADQGDYGKVYREQVK